MTVQEIVCSQPKNNPELTLRVDLVFEKRVKQRKLEKTSKMDQRPNNAECRKKRLVSI